MRKSFVALLLIFGVAALTANAFAIGNEDVGGVKVMNANIASMMHSRAAKLGVSAVANDTIWVGYSTGPGVSNYWSVGAAKGPAVQPTPGGKPRPGPNSGFGQNNTDGIWTWDHPVHGDSLQGWWPVRLVHNNISGATLTDNNRTWWAIDAGNMANYVINEGHVAYGTPGWETNPGSRTFGVIGVWHSSGGASAAQTLIPGTNAQPPAWLPLGGSKSAWMGLRGHGDLTEIDPITHNPFNAQCEAFQGIQAHGSNTVYGDGTSKHFPGYGNQMDQMMYRDFFVANDANDLTVSFEYQTAMSTGKDGTDKSRVGWYEGDPLSIATGNFITAEAGIPATSQAPVDSFQVYVGRPEEVTYHPSNSSGTAAIYDPLHRWFNEVLNRNDRVEVWRQAGDQADVIVTLKVKAATKNLFRDPSSGLLRLVFRVHTNRGFDDENYTISSSTSYNSGYLGAAQVDNVSINGTTIGDFEGSTQANDINNSPSLSALQAWKSTGKAPAIYFHVHDLNSLASRYFDLCGGPNAPTDICNLWGQVISMGDHDNTTEQEAFVGGNGLPDSPDYNGFWGMVSPTINLTGNTPTAVNGFNLNADEAVATEDYWWAYDLYTGIFNAPAGDAALWQFGFQTYPVRASDGTYSWSEINFPGFRYFNPDPQCFTTIDQARANGCILTSNASSVPDSIRLFIQKQQECYRFPAAGALCGLTGGLGLLDNISLMLTDGAPASISADIWQFYSDTFPFNEVVTPGNPPPSTFAAFDTCTALLKMGINIAQTTGTNQRFDVPGDSMTVNANGAGDQLRMDLIFRVNPGPGNYVIPGTVSSGLCAVPSTPPTSRVAFTPGSNCFWDVYSSDPGDFASAGAVAQHAAAPSGWSSLVWNSARCDTSYITLFPVLGAGDDPTGGGIGAFWSSTYHEAELATHPKRAAYAAAHKRLQCFINDSTYTAGSSILSQFVTCGTLPSYFRVIPWDRLGFNGDSLTTQAVKILPDGIFTPGTHVEYFFRRQTLTGPETGKLDYCPDTTFADPQPAEANFDAHRWQEFSVLPDQWKATQYGGHGNACILYVDWNDRRGEETNWVSVADSIGATAAADRGNHNGWAAPGGTGGADGAGQVNDPAFFVNKNKSGGTSWDMYGVKASESINTSPNTLGSRLSYHDHTASNLTDGKDARNAPTEAMLHAYYNLILVCSGDLNTPILGPFKERSADDVGTLQDFLLSSGSTVGSQKAVWAIGDGFAEDADNSGVGSPQFGLLTNYLGAQVSPVATAGYRTASGNANSVADLLPTTALAGPSAASYIYGVRNGCLYTNDVLALSGSATTPNAVVGARYQNVGTNGGPDAYAETIVNVNPPSGTQNWISAVSGTTIGRLRSRFDINGFGRLQFMSQGFANLFGTLCTFVGSPMVALDAPNSGNGRQFVDFVGNFSSNPLRSGSAAVRFGLASGDRVEVDVYDVSGRQVRKLADRMFAAGEHTLTWDGVSDQGQMVPRGVYFTQVKFVGRNFHEARKLIVLK